MENCRERVFSSWLFGKHESCFNGSLQGSVNLNLKPGTNCKHASREGSVVASR